MMKKISAVFLNEDIVAFGLSAISFCIYLATMCRSVGFTDSGELASTAYTLGIAHPTGYPLFTVLGRCWSMIPTPVEEIVHINVFTALLTAVAVGLFFKTSLSIRRAMLVFQPKERKRKDALERRFFLAALCASFIVAFSTTFWSQSTSIEVYALHLVLLLSTIHLFIGGLEEQLAEPAVISRKFILFAFLLGLSFSNHMTTVLLAPGFLWLYFRTFGFRRESFILILNLIFFFLLGLSMYAYLPVRSAHHPVLDWGHPATLERFFWHVSGKQFRVWMFSGWSVAQKQLSYYIQNFPSEFYFPVILCLIAGLIELFRQVKRLLVFFILLFGTTLLYAVNYDIFDIDSYFLLSYLIAGFIIAYGIFSLLGWRQSNKPWAKIGIAVLIGILPVMQLLAHWEHVDETWNTVPHQFIEKAFSDLEPHAIVIASSWDYFISPSLYYQLIRHERRDVTIVDKSLLQDRTWYFLQLEQNAPWLMERIRPYADLFLLELEKFEHGIPLNYQVIRTRWQTLLSQIVEQSLPDRPVYIDVRIDQEFSPEYKRIPSGLFLRLAKTADSSYYRPATISLPSWKNNSPVTKDFTLYYSTMLLKDAYWLIQKGEKDRARKILQDIFVFDPGNPEANWLVQQVSKK